MLTKDGARPKVSDSDAQVPAEKSRLTMLSAAFALFFAALAVPLLMQPHAMSSDRIAASLLLALALSLLSAIDTVSLRLPDLLTVPLLLAGLLFAAAMGSKVFVWQLASALLGGVALYGIGWVYRQIRGRDGLGLGDAKLFAAAGAWTSAEGLPSILLIACAAALAVVLGWRLAGKSIEGGSAIPFGPFIAIGLWIVWLYGPLA